MKNKKNYLSSLISHFPFLQRGFTLIEIMVVISVTAVLGTMGIAGFSNYNQAQVLQTSTNEVVTMLNLAKSRAQSQVKLSTACIGTLQGYQVEIADNTTYKLRVVSSDCPLSPLTSSSILGTKALPKGVSFDVGIIGKTIFFPVQTGGAKSSGSIICTPTTTACVITLSAGSGREKFIVINSLGDVSVKSSEPTLVPTSTPTPTSTITPTPTLGQTQVVPPPTQQATLTLKLTNPNNPSLYAWSAAIYNRQTKAWVSSGQLNIVGSFVPLAALSPTDIDPCPSTDGNSCLSGVNFLLKILEYVGPQSLEYGPYLVTIPNADTNGLYGAYTWDSKNSWNSKNGSVATGGSFINISTTLNNSLMTGTVNSLESYIYYDNDGNQFTGWKGNVYITKADDIPAIPAQWGQGENGLEQISPAVPSPLNIAKYFVGTTLEKTILSSASLELYRSLIGNLSYSGSSWRLNFLGYTSAFAGTIDNRTIVIYSSCGDDYCTESKYRTTYTVSGKDFSKNNLSSFAVAIIGVPHSGSNYLQFDQFPGPETDHTTAQTAPFDFYVCSGDDCKGTYSSLSMYANPNPSASAWNQSTWRTEGWIFVASQTAPKMIVNIFNNPFTGTVNNQVVVVSTSCGDDCSTTSYEYKTTYAVSGKDNSNNSLSSFAVAVIGVPHSGSNYLPFDQFTGPKPVPPATIFSTAQTTRFDFYIPCTEENCWGGTGTYNSLSMYANPDPMAPAWNQSTWGTNNWMLVASQIAPGVIIFINR